MFVKIHNKETKGETLVDELAGVQIERQADSFRRIYVGVVGGGHRHVHQPMGVVGTQLGFRFEVSEKPGNPAVFVDGVE